MKQDKAIELMLSGKKDRKIAAELGISERTLHRWRTENTTFILELNARRKEIWRTQVDRLRGMMCNAVDIFQQEMTEQEDHRIRLTAAVHLLKSVGLYDSSLLRPAQDPTDEAAEGRSKLSMLVASMDRAAEAAVRSQPAVQPSITESESVEVRLEE